MIMVKESIQKNIQRKHIFQFHQRNQDTKLKILIFCEKLGVVELALYLKLNLNNMIELSTPNEIRIIMELNGLKLENNSNEMMNEVFKLK